MWCSSVALVWLVSCGWIGLLGVDLGVALWWLILGIGGGGGFILVAVSLVGLLFVCG